MTDRTLTYQATGVDYASMDPFKQRAQMAARETAGVLKRHGFHEVTMSRGESAYLIETIESYLAHVEEGLGTKNLVADAMEKLTGTCYYDQIAQDTVAMIVNDMITLGALPLSVAMHLAVGDSDWFKDEERVSKLIQGWQKACLLSRATWGGGETPTLKGVVLPNAVVLSGSAIGIVKPKKRLIMGAIQDKDVIILVESSGIHANGLTLARKIAETLPEGYLTKLTDGRTYGETLLDPTPIYVPIIEDCLDHDVDIHYAVNITGHGWRKLMRSPEPFTYVIEHLPKQLPIFDFIQKHGPVDDREAYGNLNMGAGFALYVPKKDVGVVWNILHSYEQPLRFGAVIAGYIEKSDDKKVVIKPKDLVYTGETLAVR